MLSYYGEYSNRDLSDNKHSWNCELWRPSLVLITMVPRSYVYCCKTLPGSLLLAVACGSCTHTTNTLAVTKKGKRLLRFVQLLLCYCAIRHYAE